VTDRSSPVICTCMTDDFHDRSVTAFLIVFLFVLVIVLAFVYHY
jgi:multisubunit Na+/H+ antiporter MnhB subunit